MAKPTAEYRNHGTFLVRAGERLDAFMSRLTNSALVVPAILLVVLGYFVPNIYGYYRFKVICDKEGGLRVHHKLRRGEGWAAHASGAYDVASFDDNVPFVRMPDRFGHLFDYRYRGGLPGDDRSYEATPANTALPVVYEIRSVSEQLSDETRLRRSGFEVREMTTGRLMIRWYQFGYSVFDQNRTLFAAPSLAICHPYNGFFEPLSYRSYFVD
jgi:hypothetical protein